MPHAFKRIYGWDASILSTPTFEIHRTILKNVLQHTFNAFFFYLFWSFRLLFGGFFDRQSGSRITELLKILFSDVSAKIFCERVIECIFFFGEIWYVWSVLQYLKIKYRIVLNAHSWQKKVSLIILTNQIIFLFKIFKQLFKFIITIKNCRMFNQITKQSINRQPLKHSLHKQTKRFFIPKNRPKNPNKKPMYVQKPGKRSTIMMEC